MWHDDGDSIVFRVTDSCVYPSVDNKIDHTTHLPHVSTIFVIVSALFVKMKLEELMAARPE